ncbi:MAG: FecR domain-containing protein [Undibacterium sp.]|nr:FecR domain-containing protein [Opitutaceae bacterium]
MPDFSPSADATAAAAALWLARRDRGLTVAETAEFAAWKATPALAAEFARLARSWDAADFLQADPGLAALAQSVDLATAQDQRRRATARRRRVWGGGLAAAAIALSRTLWPGAPAPTVAANDVIAPADGVELVPATARRLTLADGSWAEVRGNGKLRPHFTAGERRVQLVSGEAHFHVVKDASRPFVVEAAGLAVRAVGTAFNVRLDAAAVEVTVTEGKISLHDNTARFAPTPTTIMLVAGQRVLIETTAEGVPSLAALAVEAATPAEIEPSLSWQGSRLVLTRATLAEAVEAFNRVGPQRLEIGDDVLRTRRLSGTFRADNADARVRLFEQAAEVKVERRDDGVVVVRAAR